MTEYLDSLIERYPCLKETKESISDAYSLLCQSIASNGKLLVCGNGGSSADADHIVGELMKAFCAKRPIPQALRQRLLSIDTDWGGILAEGLEGTIPAINLAQHTALTTAYANDRTPALAFAQQVLGYGQNGDVLLGISTSGNSQNVVFASIVAQAKGMKVISLTGGKPATLDRFSDISIKVPETETYKIQELHLPIYHCLCLMLEATFWPDLK